MKHMGPHQHAREEASAPREIPEIDPKNIIIADLQGKPRSPGDVWSPRQRKMVGVMPTGQLLEIMETATRRSAPLSLAGRGKGMSGYSHNYEGRIGDQVLDFGTARDLWLKYSPLVEKREGAES